MAIVLALFFVIIVGGLVASGAAMMKATTTRAELRFRQHAQATQFARSGLTEALSWFRRQTAQPVTIFAPVEDTGATPPVLDTEDPVIGLVRDFQIEQDVWGRYEVWKRDESDPDAVRLEFRRKYQCEDLSASRGFVSAGNVWLVRALGYVYRLRDSEVAWNEPPNRVIAMVTLESEIQRLSLQPPAQAALSIGGGSNAVIGTNGRIRGGPTGAGIFYPAATGTPSIGPLAEQRVTGTPSLSSSATYEDSVRSVFGVSAPELRSMADIVVTDPNDFPDPVPANSIVFADAGTITFDAARSLNGGGVVFSTGDIVLAPGNNSSFSGLLYLQADLQLRETSDIYGAVVCNGSVDARGSGDYATIWFDDAVLTDLRIRVGQYRWSGALRSILSRE